MKKLFVPPDKPTVLNKETDGTMYQGRKMTNDWINMDTYFFITPPKVASCRTREIKTECQLSTL